nr:MAG TPA: hypothetical protein [Caudoviricetes sp.]
MRIIEVRRDPPCDNNLCCQSLQAESPSRKSGPEKADSLCRKSDLKKAEIPCRK